MEIFGRSAVTPGEGYADLPPGVGFGPKDGPLRRAIDLPGGLLGQVLVEQKDEGFLRTDEEIRLLCKELRSGFDPELDGRLRRRIEGPGGGELRKVVRAFSVYFQLVNIAERYHRIRRRRQYEASPEILPHKASLASALSRPRDDAGLREPGALQGVLDGLNVQTQP